MLSPDTRKFIQADLLAHEAFVPWMYCDNRGLVTVGIGNLLATADAAADLPFINKVTGLLVSDDTKRSAWDAVRRAYQKDHAAGAYQSCSALRLGSNVALELMNKRLDSEFLPVLYRLFHTFDQWPQAAQRASMDMIYSLGTGRGISEFVNWIAAGQRGDFATMAQECVRSSGRRNPTPTDPQGLGPRNLWTIHMFQEAARGAHPTG